MKKIIIFIIPFICGCATVNSLPQSASLVDFDSAQEGRTGWSKYEEVFFLKGVDKRTAYLAAKSGLSDAGFSIKRANFNEGFAIGEHGATKYDWNVVAGVYIHEEKDGSSIKVIAQGSKDFGFQGDMTQKSWPQEIFKSIRQYIYTESNIDDPNQKIFQ